MRHVMMRILVAISIAGLAACGSPSPTPAHEFGVLVSADEAARTVTVQDAALFTDADAEREAAKDGISIGSPFYVRKGTGIRTLALADDATITLLGYDADGNFSPTPASAAMFLAGGPVRDATPYYWFDVTGGRIVGVTAVETP